nr:CPBP family intramembrane glutamic endopeptidase [Halobellus ruber]
MLDRARRAVRSWRAESPRPAARGPAATDLREHAWKWAVPACLLLLVAAEGRSLASVGWQVASPPVALRQVCLGLVALFGVNILTAPLWARVGDRGESLAAGVGAFATLSVPERLFVAITAGATEETAFHGYAIERLLALTGSLPLAGGVGFAAFAVGHLGDTWDRHAVARIAQPALVTTLLYLQFRSLPVLVAIHALHDAAVLLLAERFAARTGGGDGSDADDGAPVAVRWLGRE